MGTAAKQKGRGFFDSWETSLRRQGHSRKTRPIDLRRRIPSHHPGDSLFSEKKSNRCILFNLAAFAPQFVIRRLATTVFGRIGCLVGRQCNFILTLTLMGGSTIVIGLLSDRRRVGHIHHRRTLPQRAENCFVEQTINLLASARVSSTRLTLRPGCGFRRASDTLP